MSQPDLQRESSSAYGESGESDGSSREEEEEKGVSHNDIMKETEQELLDEMIVKDVPESESSSDPVKKFEETQLTSAGIESIPEDSDSECKDESFNNLVLASNIPQHSFPNLSITKSSPPPPEETTEISGPSQVVSMKEETETKILVKSASSSDIESEVGDARQSPAPAGPAETLTTTDSEAVISRPSSSDLSGVIQQVEESPVVLRRPKQAEERQVSSEYSDSEVERPEMKSHRPESSDYDSDMMPERLSLKDKISKFNVEPSASTETEPRHSRPSSSDFSEAFDKSTVAENKIENLSEHEEEQQGKEGISGSSASVEKIMEAKLPSRPSSSDYSDIFEKKETTETKEIKTTATEIVEETVKHQEIMKEVPRPPSSSDYSDDVPVESDPGHPGQGHTELGKPGRPISSDYSDIFDPINKTDDKVREDEDDEPMESIKDRISKFNSGSVTSLDREGRQRYPSGSVSSLDRESRIFTSETFGRTIQIEEKVESISVQEEVKPVESVKDRISKFNSGSVSSLEREAPPRPPSSDYSDIQEQKKVGQRNEVDSASAAADKVVLAELPVSTITDKMSKFTLESAQSSGSSRPVSSDYSDIFDIKTETANKEIMEDEPMESIKERISRFNSGSVTSLDRETGHKIPSRPTSGYSDFGERKALFEGMVEETTASKTSLVSVTSSETESDVKPTRQSSSEYSDFEEKIDLKAGQDDKQEDVSEVTEHTETVRERSSAGEDDPGNRTDPEDLKDERITRGRSTSQSSSSECEEKDMRKSKSSSLDGEENREIQKSSSDSSMSNKKSEELTRQDAFDREEALRRKQSSSEYSESDVEGRKVESSSDYDSASNRGRRRPESMISDTSSDYDSLSNVGSRRPQSFVLDDEYDVITEEGESEKHNKEEETGSSSESEGPDSKEAGKITKRIPPPGTLKESSGEDDDQDGDDQSNSYPSQIPQPSQSSMASGSSMHVEQSSVSVNVVQSQSSLLQESSVTVKEITSTTNIDAKNMAEITGTKSEDLAQSSSERASRQSTSSASSFDLQAQKDGSSESGKSQGTKT